MSRYFNTRFLQGKRADYLALVKDLSGSHANSSSGATGRQAALNHQQAANNAISNWNSIFPNVNYDFINDDWEKKIIIDPEVRHPHPI